jgi:hypothetical protein
MWLIQSSFRAIVPLSFITSALDELGLFLGLGRLLSRASGIRSAVSSYHSCSLSSGTGLLQAFEHLMQPEVTDRFGILLVWETEAHFSNDDTALNSITNIGPSPCRNAHSYRLENDK